MNQTMDQSSEATAERASLRVLMTRSRGIEARALACADVGIAMGGGAA